MTRHDRDQAVYAPVALGRGCARDIDATFTHAAENCTFCIAGRLNKIGAKRKLRLVRSNAKNRQRQQSRHGLSDPKHIQRQEQRAHAASPRHACSNEIVFQLHSHTQPPILVKAI